MQTGARAVTAFDELERRRADGAVADVTRHRVDAQARARLAVVLRLLIDDARACLVAGDTGARTRRPGAPRRPDARNCATKQQTSTSA